MDYKPLHFIGEYIEIQFDKPPLLKKKPSCPDRFVWQGTVYEIHQILGEWQDFKRRGDMTHNMRPANTAKALKRGSWGVGRFYFRVLTGEKRIFELYYDRAPKDAKDRSGSWILYRELSVL
jgi:hypothetical protein